MLIWPILFCPSNIVTMRLFFNQIVVRVSYLKGHLGNHLHTVAKTRLPQTSWLVITSVSCVTTPTCLLHRRHSVAINRTVITICCVEERKLLCRSINLPLRNTKVVCWTAFSCLVPATVVCLGQLLLELQTICMYEYVHFADFWVLYA